MKVGIDFDNTIVCYDEAFYSCAIEKELIPADLPLNKAAVKAYLQSHGREEDWISLQGYVYGPGIVEARPYSGVLEFMRKAQGIGHQVVIISHKTRHPYRGPGYDLHGYASRWLNQQGFIGHVIEDDDILFELTINEKLARIRDLSCDFFIDDLPSILGHRDFPDGVKKVLFDPSAQAILQTNWLSIGHWDEASKVLGL